MMYIETFALRKKSLYKWVKWVCDYEPEGKRQSRGVETHWLSGKENVSVAVISKEGDTDSLQGQERPFTIDLFKKGTVIKCFHSVTPEAIFHLIC